LVCGNGSDELIDLLIRCFVNPDEEVLICPPTFSMYSFFAQLAQANVIEVPRKPNLEVDTDRVLRNLSTKTKLIFVDSPGNPAGTLVTSRDVERLCRTSSIVVIDEAYFEYAGKTVAALIRKYKNLVVLRTLSKWAGLASLRIGYAIANPAVIELLNAVKSPYNVNTFAQEIAEQVVANPKLILKEIKQLVLLRNKVIKRLKRYPSFTVFPSESAYIVFKSSGGKTSELNNFLRRRGIILKSLNQQILGECLRLNLGTNDEINSFLRAIEDWSKKPAQIKKYDAVIFDMDGVLIDVSKSYRKAIELTVNQVSQGKSISQNEVSLIKQVEGFNNDWDASYALTKLVNENVPRKQWAEFAKKLLPIDREDSLYKKMFEAFQTYYLGSKLFQERYQKQAPFMYLNGLISKEKCLIDPSLLDQLVRANYKLAIATGRPKFEAIEAITKAQLTRFFSNKNIVALEDAAREKPAPDPLLEAQRKVRAKNPVYIGDSPNDILASLRAQMACISIGIKGGDMNFREVNQIREVLL
ncbi:aminotransferase class I/II-fold pyridoxal phosphate-dependent enzyme, partial [Candidatus Woesebacteria bacterium]|nr:aminotransferase class I/II-fold pyridoxal phosphate-dependent enzyme [Candidatus Woesebacteria bacterium]